MNRIVFIMGHPIAIQYLWMGVTFQFIAGFWYIRRDALTAWFYFITGFVSAYNLSRL